LELQLPSRNPKKAAPKKREIKIIKLPDFRLSVNCRIRLFD